ncbi:MAG: hypothetical protein KAJ49_09455 [Arcobacteraceae bacterium]|nr:hypothetical protein [Arcobacteraceae bacterium]
MQDDYFTKVYDKELIKEDINCLSLKLSPYSTDIYNTANKLYNFKNNCEHTLTIKYKTNIACNSKHNKNKEFNSFIQLDLSKNGKVIYTIYKDLTTQDINDEIKKGYNKLCKKINL